MIQNQEARGHNHESTTRELAKSIAVFFSAIGFGWLFPLVAPVAVGLGTAYAIINVWRLPSEEFRRIAYCWIPMPVIAAGWLEWITITQSAFEFDEMGILGMCAFFLIGLSTSLLAASNIGRRMTLHPFAMASWGTQLLVMLLLVMRIR